MTTEPYIQNLFAERIGGNRFGKDTAIYKFEKIKRAKRAAHGSQSRTWNSSTSASASPTKWRSRRWSKRSRDEAAQTGKPRVTPTTAASRSKPPPRDTCATMCGVDGRSGDAGHPFHRQQTRAGHAGGGADQSRRRGVDDRARLPGLRHARAILRRRGAQPASCSRKTASCPTSTRIPADVLDRAKVLVLNYPNNPTGASATPEFFAKVVAFAREHRLAVIHDFAYAALVFEGKPLSFLATPGAMDVGVELHSTSKNFNMTGWRCGFVAGNERLVKAYGAVKDNTDSGPVPGDPERERLCVRPSGDHRADRREIFPPDGPARADAAQPGFRGGEAARQFFPLRRPRRRARGAADGGEESFSRTPRLARSG